MKINKLAGVLVALAIIGLSVGNALTGHGIKGNKNLNLVVLGTGGTGGTGGTDSTGGTGGTGDGTSTSKEEGTCSQSTCTDTDIVDKVKIEKVTYSCKTGSMRSCKEGSETKENDVVTVSNWSTKTNCK